MIGKRSLYSLVFVTVVLVAAGVAEETKLSPRELERARARLEELEKREAQLRQEGRSRLADNVRWQIDQLKKKLSEAGAKELVEGGGDVPREAVDEMVKALKEALKKNDRAAILDAIRKLVRTKDKKAAEEVARCLYHREVGVRTEAARGLGRMGIREAVPFLMRACSTYAKKNATLLAVLDALGDLKDKRATKQICYTMRSNGQYDAIDRGCRALEKIRDRNSVKPLIDMLAQNRRPADWPPHGRVMRCLHNLTGQMAGARAEDWKHWWLKNKNSFEIVPESSAPPPGTGEDGKPKPPGGDRPWRRRPWRR